MFNSLSRIPVIGTALSKIFSTAPTTPRSTTPENIEIVEPSPLRRGLNMLLGAIAAPFVTVGLMGFAICGSWKKYKHPEAGKGAGGALLKSVIAIGGLLTLLVLSAMWQPELAWLLLGYVCAAGAWVGYGKTVKKTT